MAPNEQMSIMLMDVAARIRELREIIGLGTEEMAAKTDLTPDVYVKYESGLVDLPFTFIHKCALVFGVELTELLEGSSAHLSSYTVTRRGKGRMTAQEPGIDIKDLAPLFRHKIVEPFWVTYAYSEEQQSKPIALVGHAGQEFDIILSGSLKVQIGEHTEILNEGDSIYYNSTTPHGMIAVGGRDCVFCAVVIPGEPAAEEKTAAAAIEPAVKQRPLIYEEFVETVEDGRGVLQSIFFKNEDRFNFAFDVVDAIAAKAPGKLAMLHLDREKVERRFTFEDMSRLSSRAANYFCSLGVKKGDRVMLVLRRNYQFWIAIIALHKLGAIAIPATDQLLQKDFEYRFGKAGVSAIVCTADGGAAEEAELAIANCPFVATKIMAGGSREGWHDFDSEISMFRGTYNRTDDSACGSDLAVMFFSSGTTGYPKLAEHTHKYPLGHFITAKYWHNVDPDGIHLTISDTGWGKALWGKLYGQWLCEAAIFTYDFDRFDSHDILPMFAKYNITTFCAPPTMYRFFIKEDLSKYDLSSIKYATTAGEALNPEVFHQFKKATGLTIMEGFGQTETTLSIANLVGSTPKIGSMGKPSPLYDMDIVDPDGNPVGIGETGEIVIRTGKGIPCGLFNGYYDDEEKTQATWHDGLYHTGDTAWRDEEGYFWFVGRIDDVIKSSGYRIGPFEIESVIMELPYVLECAVSPAPDEVRGQVVKASIVLTKGTEPTEDLKKEIQDYVKTHTAPYKYPRIIVFRDTLPKTISGKIQRNKL
ncbi:transcriptional regulator, XRE family with cupin sensor [Sporobacter termitidis DSM 10068]|uniref:Transcriptional regulator, XRE family with cupin sensor n=1 Tax=Sporobacter termitidis DSM 10068 TaxID=1123282 RepID=A0A1M5YMM9_9FIRM|nr:AMP-binding protein [Sporobacter termitidis]SHI13246.1 transcriptional regulator, XRE family with cupin sensor [Sporobacter termitidis DSM 10068]